jgi:hypothetical protein
MMPCGPREWGNKYVPVPVLPALMLVDGDLNGVTELTLHDLYLSILALFVITTCTVVGGRLW